MMKSIIIIIAIHTVAVYSDERDEFFSSVFSAVMSNFPTDLANNFPSANDWNPSFPTAAPTSIEDSTDDSSSTHDHEHIGLSPGIIAAVAVGSVVGVAIIIAAIVLLWRRNQNVNKTQNSVSYAKIAHKKRISKTENGISRHTAEKTAAPTSYRRTDSQRSANNGSQAPNSQASSTVVGSQIHGSDFYYREEVPHALDTTPYYKQTLPGLEDKTLHQEVPHTQAAATYYEEVPHTVESAHIIQQVPHTVENTHIIQHVPRAYYSARKPDALNITNDNHGSSAPRLVLKPVKPDGA
ncbi:hypothetical protein BJV82DRAFT_617917 [Fennellomyces sp. T-0311]|nr:hypothetical protein BJV82DRAFT_617917 [Fennellomyces sp. T-0311]